MHRNSRLKKTNEMQQYANIYLLLNYCACFERPSRSSSGVGIHKTVVAASGTDHTIWRASFLKRDQIRTDLGPSAPNQSLFGHVWGSLNPRYYDLQQNCTTEYIPHSDNHFYDKYCYSFTYLSNYRKFPLLCHFIWRTFRKNFSFFHMRITFFSQPKFLNYSPSVMYDELKNAAPYFSIFLLFSFCEFQIL